MTRQAKLRTCFGIVAVVFLAVQVLHVSNLDIDDAFFLTKNSIKELQTQYMCKRRRVQCETEPLAQKDDVRRDTGSLNLDLEFPFSNVMNSVFPIDLVVSYNISNTTEMFPARYASFSPVLSGQLISNYAIVDGYGCVPVNASAHPEYKDKILIVLRGQCTFVKKVENLAGEDLHARAVIVANDEPYRNLITMYLSTFNDDGTLSIPVMFMAYEDYTRLKYLEEKNIQLAITTALVDNWISLMILMVISPPLLIVVFYVAMRTIQFCHRRRVSTMNLRLVRRMVVYIYGHGHLVPAPVFNEYLTRTGQSAQVQSQESVNETDDTDNDFSTSSVNVNRGVNGLNGVNGCNLQGLKLLFAPRDYYPTQKCAICLDRFVPLHLRVLVLECGHIFHEACLLNWLINFRRSCPLCNEPLSRTLHHLLGEDLTSYGAVDLENGLSGSTRAVYSLSGQTVMEMGVREEEMRNSEDNLGNLGNVGNVGNSVQSSLQSSVVKNSALVQSSSGQFNTQGLDQGSVGVNGAATGTGAQSGVPGFALSSAHLAPDYSAVRKSGQASQSGQSGQSTQSAQSFQSAYSIPRSGPTQSVLDQHSTALSYMTTLESPIMPITESQLLPSTESRTLRDSIVSNSLFVTSRTQFSDLDTRPILEPHKSRGT